MTTVLADKKIALLPSRLSTTAVEQALEKWNALSFPTRKTEDWRYVKLGKLIKKEYQLPTAAASIDITPFLLGDYPTLVFVNGLFMPNLSTFNPQNGLTVLPIEEAKQHPDFIAHYNQQAKDSNEMFTALNTAYTSGGVFISAAKNSTIEKPVYIVHISTEGTQHFNLRHLIIANQGAQLSVIQGFYHTTNNENFNNTLSEVVVQANANLSMTKLQQDAPFASHICTEEVTQASDSTFKIHTVITSGGLIRNGLNIRVDGSNCYTEMNGLILGKGEQVVDNHTRVDHLKPHCISSELYKYMMNDNATGIFNGKVIVHEDAQKIQAYQQNNNILLSEIATMNAKPELEIFADDVKCSHGTTTGQFDEKAIFYLQARGVSKESAKKMLVDAVADEVLEKLEDEIVHMFVKNLI
jgi:Fe-S cluster assembly protein SufD